MKKNLPSIRPILSMSMNWKYLNSRMKLNNNNKTLLSMNLEMNSTFISLKVLVLLESSKKETKSWEPHYKTHESKSKDLNSSVSVSNYRSETRLKPNSWINGLQRWKNMSRNKCKPVIELAKWANRCANLKKNTENYNMSINSFRRSKWI